MGVVSTHFGLLLFNPANSIFLDPLYCTVHSGV